MTENIPHRSHWRPRPSGCSPVHRWCTLSPALPGARPRPLTYQSAAGRDALTADVFSVDEPRLMINGHDVVMHLRATNIPTGANAALKSGWATNDRLRRDVHGCDRHGSNRGRRRPLASANR
ncbi:MAG: hypothetical protein R2706_21105 [Acidimicrobiales bacterium]